jgi:hypothetical protein
MDEVPVRTAVPLPDKPANVSVTLAANAAEEATLTNANNISLRIIRTLLRWIDGVATGHRRETTRLGLSRRE